VRCEFGSKLGPREDIGRGRMFCGKESRGALEELYLEVCKGDGKRGKIGVKGEKG
jgi:hypothetical protein